MLQAFCREKDMIFILDEVQSNFGRTGDLFAFETYGLEPDVVVLGKGLGNGVPVAAAAGRADLFAVLDYGEASDTWSANPLCCAAVLATLEEFAAHDVLGDSRRASAVLEQYLVRLKELPFIAHIRGEKGGMVWGVETRDHAGRTASEWANALVLACYQGEPGGDGIHFMGPLAKKVVRVGAAADTYGIRGARGRGVVESTGEPNSMTGEARNVFTKSVPRPNGRFAPDGGRRRPWLEERTSRRRRTHPPSAAAGIWS